MVEGWQMYLCLAKVNSITLRNFWSPCLALGQKMDTEASRCPLSWQHMQERSVCHSLLPDTWSRKAQELSVRENNTSVISVERTIIFELFGAGLGAGVCLTRLDVHPICLYHPIYTICRPLVKLQLIGHCPLTGAYDSDEK